MRLLTDDETKTFFRLLSKVRAKSKRNRLRTQYFEAKKKLDKIGFSIPPHMHDFAAVIGWANKTVRVPARRIRPDGFTLPRESELLSDIEDIFEDNYLAAVERMAIEASLQYSVSFLFVTPGDASLGEPEVIVAARSALEATAEVDERTNRVLRALEIVNKRKMLLYLPGLTLRIESLESKWFVTAEYDGVPNHVPCTPYIWGRSLDRPFGSSRITRPVMDFTDMAVRTMLRQEGNAEFYSSPQRALMGADEAHFTDAKGNRISPLDALLGGIWALPDTFDEEEGKLVRPDLKQLAQATMQPHTDMLKTIAMMFSGESSIPVGYLGIIQDNPSSADAIRANEADLVSVVEAELPSIGVARLDLARNVLAVKHGEFTPGMASELKGLRAHFADAGTPTRSAQADAGLKFTQAFPWAADSEVALEYYGMNKTQITRLMAARKLQQNGQRLDALVAAAKAPATTEPA
ncbi:hypothetical protein SRABI26_02718 [Arthrobacter sp. Bi26]|uniref:hypothetical protein n=1 Tax=Arthrobacter sp. Bi26 TaxID=2822350 RepID=UPI001E082268|nr:hypothetical protein [Arthrobacter sp. Bi26]CAH0233722.1 hypothetical protein SRABI26_02718 [Arthrobacter sp. Bi26]